MSLAQHVTSTEGVDLEPEPDWDEIGSLRSLRSRRGSVGSNHLFAGHKTVRRVLSYDAFPPQQPPEQTYEQSDAIDA